MVELSYKVTNEDVIRFVDYFDGKVQLNLKNIKKYEKEIGLEEAMKIYANEDLIDIRKIYELSKIYKHGKDIRKAFSKIFKYREDYPFFNEYCDKIEEIASYLEKNEEKGLIQEAKRLVENEQELEDIPCAIQYVERYIDSSKIFTDDFYKEENIDGLAFDYFKRLVCEFDDEVFDQFEAKSEQNASRRKSITIKKLTAMSNGITTGKDEEGYEFDRLKCYELLPFKNVENLNELIGDFELRNASSIEQKTRRLLEATVPETSGVVYKYLLENRIITQPYGFTTPSEIRKERVVVGDREVKDEEKEIIIKYLQIRDIPFFGKAVSVVRNKVLDGTISFDEDKNITIKRTK